MGKTTGEEAEVVCIVSTPRATLVDEERPYLGQPGLSISRGPSGRRHTRPPHSETKEQECATVLVP